MKDDKTQVVDDPWVNEADERKSQRRKRHFFRKSLPPEGQEERRVGQERRSWDLWLQKIWLLGRLVGSVIALIVIALSQLSADTVNRLVEMLRRVFYGG